MTRIGVLAGILAMVGMTQTGFAGSEKLVDETRVPVCIGNTPQLGNTPGQAMAARAWTTAQVSKMFFTAGVTIDWRTPGACPADGIRIHFSQATKPEDHPGVSAYALPYEGTTIVVFYDRILQAALGGGNGTGLRLLLAHVMVHEITHVLQGFARHSHEGVMKASFTLTDQEAMRRSPLDFTSSDVTLLHSGLAKRNSGLKASR